MQEESENLEDLVAEMSALECTYDGCTAGEGGAKFKTPALAPAQAVAYLRFHREDAHVQHGAAAGGGAKKVPLSKIPRPELSGHCSQEVLKVLELFGLLLRHVELPELLHHCGLVKLQLGGLHLVKGVVAEVGRFLWALEGN